MKDKITKLINVFKKYGFIGFIKKCWSYVIANYINKISFKVFFNKKKYRKEISRILQNDYERIILWRSSFGYNVELFQRPQHIASNLINNRCLVIYEVTTMTDKVKTLKKIKDNFYLFNFNNVALNKILMQELMKIHKPKYIQLYSTDWTLSLFDIQSYIDKGFKLIYEYIDHIAAELAGTKEIPKNVVDKYEYAMNNKDVYIVVTADELKKDVEARRGNKNMVYSSNGVDYNFFKYFDDNYVFDNKFLDVINNGKINVCYYGALASWFDYDLVKKIAKTNKYNIILFGVKYDETYDAHMKDIANVYFLGSREYKVLKNYANKCDIMIIPFLLNDITKSTSPVKLFEYMALHKPIVTTNLYECRKYKSVLIGENHDDFINKLDEAYNMKNDKKYIALLDKEAKENDWANKAKVIVELIKKDE